MQKIDPDMEYVAKSEPQPIDGIRRKANFSYFSNSKLMMFSGFPDNQSSKCQVKTFVNLHIDVAAGARILRRHLHQRQLI